ncbi:MAG: hypothetical protein JXB48_02215 [Candidatus Latescibacteria bacterium]|nr:hypothetical protein [Candidatus Latescibacterota bacterium]
MILKQSCFGFILLLCVATGVKAQIHGLSLVDMADPPGKGAKHFVGSTFVAETSALYGGRLAYGVTERLLVFTDMGVHDADYFDPEFLGQAGMRYTLPVNLPFDLALRITTIPYIASYEHYVEFTVGLLGSRYLDSGLNWAVYGNAGIDRQFWELKVPFDAETAALYGQDSYIDKGNKTELSLTLGLSKKLTNWSRFFIEAANIDEYYGCTGIRLEL